MTLNKYWIDFALNTLWKLALVMGIVMFSYLTVELFLNTESFIKNNSSILAAFFILLSASIASTSVMKSIKANQELKDIEIAREDKSKLVFIIYILTNINELMQKSKSDPMIKDNQNSVFNIIRINVDYAFNLWNKIQDYEHFSIVPLNGYENFKEINYKLYQFNLIMKDARPIKNTNTNTNDLVDPFIDSITKNLNLLINILNNINKEK